MPLPSELVETIAEDNCMNATSAPRSKLYGLGIPFTASHRTNDTATPNAPYSINQGNEKRVIKNGIDVRICGHH